MNRACSERVYLCFVASPELLRLMRQRGLPLGRNPFRPWQYLVPLELLAWHQLLELSEREDFSYIASAQLLTSPTGSNQTLNKPSDWNNSSNQIELVGAGGGGASCNRTGNVATGGGGGEFGTTTQFNFSGASITYRLGTGGAGVTPTAGATVDTNGTAGGDSWWNGTTQAGSTLGGIGGTNGTAGTGSAGRNGGAGGTGGGGPTHFAGGRGGNYTGTRAGASTATGGGGGGGDTAVGTNGTDTATSNTATGGGAGGATGGGSGGAASTTNGVAGGTGGNGTNFSSASGAGGGGGGGRWANNSAQNAGPGGNYGGGGGAAVNNGSGGGGSTQAISKAGIQGVIFVQWASLAMPFYETHNEGLMCQQIIAVPYR